MSATKLTPLLCLLLLPFGQPVAAQEAWRHPEFTLPDIATGQPVSLSDYRGRKVLLIQFASW